MVQFDVKRVSKGTESFMVSFDFTKTPITQVADYIIIAASKHKASDMHFDPREDGMMVRFRIDGDCQDYTFIPKAYERNLTTRLKLLANMNITETRLPQDGAIKGQFGDTYLDMRVSCLPTNQGEKVVIRILDYSRSLQGVDSLGFHPKNLEKIHRMMQVPNGIILVTGATGSGKSTTTYSMLSGLNKPETNIITVEDPVEMNIEGINQVQVNAEIGMTFAAALRSILRQDPNVILIGEIRDSETAQIAVRASITGHLVMSTLHTNSALSTIERLLDMDVERYLLSTALTGVISQRLGKMLCPDCRYQRETTKYEKKVFKSFLHQDVGMIWDADPKGCENCRRGYKGRVAFHEVLELDDAIRNALNNEKLKKEELIKMVYTGKTISMLQDALYKALDGLTSFEEVYKAIEIENEDEDNYEEEIKEATESKQVVEEEVEVVSTSDDLLEEEGASKSTTPLTKAIEIPGVTNNQSINTEETTENKEVAKPEEKKETTPTAAATPMIPPVVEETKPATPVEENKEEVKVETEEVPLQQFNFEIPTTTPEVTPATTEEKKDETTPATPSAPVEEKKEEPKVETAAAAPTTVPEVAPAATPLIPTIAEEPIAPATPEVPAAQTPAAPALAINTMMNPSVPLMPTLGEDTVPIQSIMNSTLPPFLPMMNDTQMTTPMTPMQSVSLLPQVPTQQVQTASNVVNQPGIMTPQTNMPTVSNNGTVNGQVEINQNPMIPTIVS